MVGKLGPQDKEDHLTVKSCENKHHKFYIARQKVKCKFNIDTVKKIAAFTIAIGNKKWTFGKP